MAQYALNMSDSLYKDLRFTAKNHDKTVRELMISLIKIGLIALDANDDSETELIYRKTDKDGSKVERAIILL
ncbi:MAG: hypothetical protein ACKE5M_08115 [Methylophilaceae bacterium]